MRRDNGGKPDWLDILMPMDTVLVMFSGGKDSSAALAHMKELAERWAPHLEVRAVFIDTTVGLPECEKFVQGFCQLLGAPLDIVRPKRDFFLWRRGGECHARGLVGVVSTLR